MTKVKLMAQKAWYVENPATPTRPAYRVTSVAFDFKDHFPTRVVDVDGTAGALRALEQYAQAAEATGKSLCVSVVLCRGERSPNGFKAANTMRYVNLQDHEPA